MSPRSFLPLLLFAFLSLASGSIVPSNNDYIATCRCRDDMRAGVTLMFDEPSHQPCSLMPDELRSSPGLYSRTTANLVLPGYAASTYFRIISSASDFTLATQKRLDREELCAAVKVCCDRTRVVCRFELMVVFRSPLETNNPGSSMGRGRGRQPVRTTFKKVAIRLRDENDHAPEFPTNEQVVRIRESAKPGTKYPLHAAQDYDSEPFSVKSYNLIPSSPQEFDLEQRSALDGSGSTRLFLRLRQSLDREKIAQYNLTLVAMDSGPPRPKTGSMAIRVMVVDENDNYPEFERSTYQVNVSEEVAVNEVLTKVHATDKDEGSNGQVYYEIAPSARKEIKRMFEMEASSGRLILRSKLDYETQRVYHVPIQAKDGAGNPNKGDAEILIYVMDVNDSPPIININYDLTRHGALKGELPENTKPPQFAVFAALVTVTDEDSGPAGEFSCWLEQTDRFQLREGTTQRSDGHIASRQFTVYQNGSLDREKRAEERFDICCADKGLVRKQECKSLEIIVTDINDHAPEFATPNQEASITENNEPQAHVTSVIATDKDEGQNAEIVYSLDAKSNAYFEITPYDGRIRARAPFDREFQDMYTLYVVAKDKGEKSQSSTATVTVRINDENDNSPVFIQSDARKDNFLIEVGEDMRHNSVIGRVQAQDLDDKNNKRIYYSLQPKRGLPFRISSDTGEISTTQKLDREKKDSYTLQVVAADSGSPPRSSTATVTIRVRDHNDNKPRFIFPSIHNNSIRLSFKEIIGEEVARIRAVDQDLGQNAVLHYQILSGNHRSLFQLDPNTGSLTVHADMTPNDVDTYRLKLSVQDSGEPVQFSHAELIVHVDHSRPRILPDGRGRYREALTRSGILVIIVALICAIILVLLCMTMYLCARKGLFGPDLIDPVGLLCHCGLAPSGRNVKRRHPGGLAAGGGGGGGGGPRPMPGGGGLQDDEDPAALAVAFLPSEGYPPGDHAYANAGSDKMCPVPQYETYGSWRPDTDSRTLGKRQTKKEVENVNEYQLSAFDRDQTPDSKAPKTDRMSRKKFDFNDSGVGGGGGQGVKASPSYPNRLQDSAGADSHRSDPQDMKGNFYEMYDALLLDQTLGKTGKYYSTQKGSFV